MPPAPVAQLVECLLQRTGGHRFNPGPWHTKVIKNGTSCSSHGTQTYGLELGQVNLSGQCDWVWYRVKCLVHDTSVRQHYKSEHWAPCCNQTPLWYDWKIIESDVKPKQITTSLDASNAVEPRHEKTCLCYMRTTKAQISLHIRAVWSAPLLFAVWIE